MIDSYPPILIHDENQIVSDCSPIPNGARQTQGFSHYALKEAVSRVWDCQICCEMISAELERYTTAKQLFRRKLFTQAIKILTIPESIYAESVNLLGAIHESAGDLDNARKCYGKAMFLDKDCWAAQMNARRIYELIAFGRSDVPTYL